jgi:arsenite-transporting ATPase
MSAALTEALDELDHRRVVLIGGKGGVGKTTLSTAAALHFARTRHVVLFTTDPASNLDDLFDSQPATRSPHPETGNRQPATGNQALPPTRNLTIEALDAHTLYAKFLERNMASFIELGDRGTYLDRDELRRFFELSLPGVDELMAWMRIGELAETNPDSLIVVDTAPTGHTLRMLSSAEHFRQLASALDAMQEKHRSMVRQFRGREVRDAMDAFIDEFEAQARRRRELLTDPDRAAFIVVMLSEPWVVEQTRQLVDEVRGDGLDVPFVILNRAVVDPDCERDHRRAADDASARQAFPKVVDAPRSCTPLDSAERIEEWLAGTPTKNREPRTENPPNKSLTLATPKLLFVAGKGGVGKTTAAASIALQLAKAHPDRAFVAISVDPAHTLPTVFAEEAPPTNLSIETIDTREKWRGFRESIGREIERVVDALTPRGLSVAYDTEALQKLVEIAPPGADELFAVTRLADLLEDQSKAMVVVDTAPTGHFLRLLDLPKTAGEWVREFMRILLHYREVVAPGTLGEELVSASRALHALEAALTTERVAVIVVTRPERTVIAETMRLLADVERRSMHIAGVIANYMTPETECPCDRSMRVFELTALTALGREAIVIERRDDPVTKLADVLSLVPLEPP